MSHAADGHRPEHLVFEPAGTRGRLTDQLKFAINAVLSLGRGSQGPERPCLCLAATTNAFPLRLLRGEPSVSRAGVLLNDVRDASQNFLPVDVIGVGLEHRSLARRLRQDLT